MKLNAIAVANYIIDLAAQNEKELKQFGLMKRVYLTHGFCLATLDRGALDPRFDVVEAWKNGPCIPSVYHSFKYNGNDSIKEKAVIVHFNTKRGEVEIETPELLDVEIKDIANRVWKRYIDFSDKDLVELLHRKGTPWELCYVEGQNRPIPDLYTKTFYQKVLDYEYDKK